MKLNSTKTIHCAALETNRWIAIAAEAGIRNRNNGFRIECGIATRQSTRNTAATCRSLSLENN
jgi:hypothetical protein